MKLIIDIPEEDYVFVKRQVADGITNPLKICIANGTPLDGVLQEIRQEIDSHGIIMQISNGEKIIGENVYIAKEIVLEIIDKHIGDME